MLKANQWPWVGFSDASIINLMQSWTNEEQVIKLSIHEAHKENTKINIQTDSTFELMQNHLI